MAAEEFSTRSDLYRRIGQVLDNESQRESVIITVRQTYYVNGGRRYQLEVA